MSPVKISVVVAAVNAADTIGPCLDSVITQDHLGVELVVIDGASSDGTVELVQARRAHIAYYVSEPDKSVYEAWNKALDHVTGDWVTFLGADDRYAAPDVLSRMATHLEPSAGRERVVYASEDVVDAQGVIVRTLGEPWPETRAEFREHMTLPHGATFQHRSLFEELGSFDEGFRIAGDYEFLLRELLKRDARYVPGVSAVRMGAGGLSDRPDLAALVVRETHRARYMHGLVAYPEWRSAAVYRSVLHAKISHRFGARAADRVGDAYRFITRAGPRRT